MFCTTKQSVCLALNNKQIIEELKERLAKTHKLLMFLMLGTDLMS